MIVGAYYKSMISMLIPETHKPQKKICTSFSEIPEILFFLRKWKGDISMQNDAGYFSLFFFPFNYSSVYSFLNSSLSAILATDLIYQLLSIPMEKVPVLGEVEISLEGLEIPHH